MTSPGSIMVILAGSLMAAPPNPGISESLARERAASIRDVRYNISFTIPEYRATPLTGYVTIEFVLDRRREVIIDFESPRERVKAVVDAYNLVLPSPRR